MSCAHQGRVVIVSAVFSSVPRVASDLRFTAPLWVHHGEGGWHFVTLPPEAADELRDSVPPRGPGFGAVRVTVTVGDTTWGTSVFPDKATGSFLLPVKKDVRRSNQLVPGDTVRVMFRPQ
jgi:hypothetical protein